MFFYQFDQWRLGACAAEFVGGLAVFKDDKGGQAAYFVGVSGFGVFYDVHFDDANFTLVGGSKFFEHGCNVFARAAPGSPEINHNGVSRLQYFGLKVGIGNRGNEVGHGWFSFWGLVDKTACQSIKFDWIWLVNAGFVWVLLCSNRLCLVLLYQEVK